MLRSGSDLIITGSSTLGAAIAKDTVGDEEEEEEEGSENIVVGKPGWPSGVRMIVFEPERVVRSYLIIVTDAADAVSVNFSGWCKFLQI